MATQNIYIEGEEFVCLASLNNEFCISRNGKLFSLPKQYNRNRKGKMLTTFIDKHGYETLFIKNYGSKLIHRLVAETFIPNIENKPQVNHIDGNKLNNNVSNLEWCTAKENINHGWKTGLYKSKPKMVTNETGQIYKSAEFAAILFGGKVSTIRNSICYKIKRLNHFWSYI